MLNIFRILTNVNVYLVAIPLVANIKTEFYYAMKKKQWYPRRPTEMPSPDCESLPG